MAITRQTETESMLQHWREAVPNDRLAHLVRDAARALGRSLSIRLAEHHVSFGHWSFLRVLWVEDGLTQRELSERVGVMEPTTFSAMKTMERLGYVVRRQHEGDRKKGLHPPDPERPLAGKAARPAGRRGQQNFSRGYRTGACRDHARGVTHHDRKSRAGPKHFGKIDAVYAGDCKVLPRAGPKRERLVPRGDLPIMAIASDRSREILTRHQEPLQAQTQTTIKLTNGRLECAAALTAKTRRTFRRKCSTPQRR